MNTLRIPNALLLETSFDRPNLKYEVLGKAKDPLKQLGQLIKDHFAQTCGIVYCLSKNECADVAKYLKEKFKIKSAHYHAGMGSRQRVSVQEKWQTGEVAVICATIAFGMGIDKPDVVSFLFMSPFFVMVFMFAICCVFLLTSMVMNCSAKANIS